MRIKINESVNDMLTWRSRITNNFNEIFKRIEDTPEGSLVELEYDNDPWGRGYKYYKLIKIGKDSFRFESKDRPASYNEIINFNELKDLIKQSIRYSITIKKEATMDQAELLDTIFNKLKSIKGVEDVDFSFTGGDMIDIYLGGKYSLLLSLDFETTPIEYMLKIDATDVFPISNLMNKDNISDINKAIKVAAIINDYLTDLGLKFINITNSNKRIY